jgi:hypothetical protein
MADTHNVIDNVTPLRRPATRKAATRRRNAERQRRYRERKAGNVLDAGLPGISSPVAAPPVAIRNAARNAAAVAAPESVHVARLMGPATVPNLVSNPVQKRATTSHWSTIGRACVGLAIISTGVFIALTSMRANAWFGHSLTPNVEAGEVYSHLSVAAEVIACLLPTGIRFYAQSGEWWTALRGWALMAVALTVVFFAAGGFAVTNLNAGTEARAERSTADTMLAQRRLDTVSKSRAAECAKRGPRCRALEDDEKVALTAAERLR